MNTKLYIVAAAAATVIALAGAAVAQSTRSPKPRKVQSATVRITEQGYVPVSVRLQRGVRTKIAFLRTTERTCGTEIVIPAYGINRPLPLNETVVVSFTPKRSGEVGFTCGMNMMHGKIVVR